MFLRSKKYQENMKIKYAKARVVLNSRAEPTIEVQINEAYESAPSGASKGKYEAKYLDPDLAVDLFNRELSDFLKSFTIDYYEDLLELEREIQSIGGIEKYGANTIIATEFAILRAWSIHNEEPIYKFFDKKPKVNIRILANVVGGGAHSKGKGLNIQEFLISPNTDNIRLSIFMAAKFYHELGKKLSLIDDKFLYGKNDEGAWVTSLEEGVVLETINELREEFQDNYNINIDLGLDVAASQLYNSPYYFYNDKRLSKKEQIEYILGLIDVYNLFYIEDPIHEDDFDSFAEINNNTKALIVGDDLTVTNIERIKIAYAKKSVKGVIIKPNQVGYLGKAIDAINYCKEHNIVPILSHRSGETSSDILAHLAYGLKVPFVKFGIGSGERILKLNELLRIYES